MSLRQVPGPGSIDAKRSRIVPAIQRLAFWIAIALSGIAVALLVGGLAARSVWSFVALLSCNVVCLVVGHGYAPGGTDRESAQKGR